jgi:hypothetical protein
MSLPQHTHHTIMVWLREKIGPFRIELEIVRLSYGVKLLTHEQLISKIDYHLGQTKDCLKTHIHGQAPSV